jgi:hypothetical protein
MMEMKLPTVHKSASTSRLPEECLSEERLSKERLAEEEERFSANAAPESVGQTNQKEW